MNLISICSRSFSKRSFGPILVGTRKFCSQENNDSAGESIALKEVISPVDCELSGGDEIANKEGLGNNGVGGAGTGSCVTVNDVNIVAVAPPGTGTSVFSSAGVNKVPESQPFDTNSANFQKLKTLYAEVAGRYVAYKGRPESDFKKIVSSEDFASKLEKLSASFVEADQSHLLFVDGGFKDVMCSGIKTGIVSLGGFCASKVSGQPLFGFSGCLSGVSSSDSELQALQFGQRIWNSLIRGFARSSPSLGYWLKIYPELCAFLSIKLYTDQMDISRSLNLNVLPATKIATNVDKAALQSLFFPKRMSMAVGWVPGLENFIPHLFSSIALVKSRKCIDKWRQSPESSAN